MLERALTGSDKYKRLLGGLLILMGLGFAAYLTQWEHGLMITGMGRDVSWGLYIAQFTFLVGVAASAVMVVLPYYVHDVKEFGKITVLGEFLAICLGHHVPSVHHGGHGQADESLECFALPHAQFDSFLGHDGFKRLPPAERLYRLECPGGRAKRDSLSEMGKAAHLPFDPLGSEHSYGYGLSDLRSSWKRVLAYRNHGRAIPRFGFLFGSCSPDPPGLDR